MRSRQNYSLRSAICQARAYPKLFPMRSRLVCDSCGPEVRPDLFEAQRAMPRVVEPEYELLVGGRVGFRPVVHRTGARSARRRGSSWEGLRFPFAMLANRLFREPVEPPRLRVGLNLAIPGIVEIDLAQTLEELGLVSLRQLLNRFDDFAHRAHMANLAETFSDRKRQRERKKYEWI